MKPITLLSALGVAFLLLAAPAQAQCWKLIKPTFPRETINDVYFTNPTNGFMVANAGIVGRSVDGGMSWVPIETPSYENLHAVTSASALSVWCGGDRGALLHSTDGGFQWTPVTLATAINIRAISFPSANNGFVCGGSTMYRTTDGGANWTQQSFSAAPYQVSNFKYLKFFSNDTGYAYSTNGRLLKTYNSGVSWSATAIPGFLTLSFATPQIGYAIGHSGNNDIYYKTIDGGTTWTNVGTVLNYNPNPIDIFVLDALNVFILNNGTGNGNTRVYHTANGGQTWQDNNYIPNIHWSTAICFTSAQTGHVADLWGSCRKTVDRAANWITLPNNIGATSGQTIFALDSAHIWQTGGVYQNRTTDGGQTWIHSVTNTGTTFITKLQFASTAVGYGKSDNNNQLCKSTNGGQTWTFGNTVGPINDFAFYSPNFGIVAKQNGMLARTTNGGQTWSSPTLPASSNFEQIACADSLHWYGFNLGDELMYRSADAGVTWSPVTAPTLGIGLFAITDSNTIFFKTTSAVYRSADGGASFQQWNGQSVWASSLRATKTDNVFAFSSYNAVFTGSPNDPRLWKVTASGWQVSPIHSSFPFNDLHYRDSNNALLTTGFGSIYKYYPAGQCPPDLMAPMLSTQHLQACAGAMVNVQIGNYTTYNPPTDTLKAQLLSGTTILWSGTPNATGQLDITMPSTAGSYTLKVTVSNPQVPLGRTTTIPVTSLVSNPPLFSFWLTLCNPAGCCVGDQPMMGMSSTANLGLGYTYELHKLAKDLSTDSIVSIGQPITTFPPVTDTFYAYYKVNLGEGVCYPGPTYYSDTVLYYVNQPTVPTLALNSATTFACPGSSATLNASSMNAGTSGRYFRFYKITATGAQSVYSGADSTLTLSNITGEGSYFCKMFPGWDNCNVMDSVTSDTVTILYVTDTIPNATTSTGPNGQCQGKAIQLAVDTASVVGYQYWELWKMNSGILSYVDSGSNVATQTHYSAAPGDSYYFKVHSEGGCAFESDTLHPVILPPQQAVLQLSATGDLEALPANASQYAWYLNSQLLITTTTPLLPQPAVGSYVVKLTMADSCIWLDSAPFAIQPTGIDNVGMAAWELYPNPTSRMLWLRKPGYTADVQVVIYDLTGQKVFEKTLQPSRNEALDLEQLAPATYTMRITEANGQHMLYKIVLLPE